MLLSWVIGKLKTRFKVSLNYNINIIVQQLHIIHVIIQAVWLSSHLGIASSGLIPYPGSDSLITGGSIPYGYYIFLWCDENYCIYINMWFSLCPNQIIKFIVRDRPKGEINTDVL